jgi:hypothetical protein
MAQTKKVAPRKPVVSKSPSKSEKKLMPKIVGAKPSEKRLLPKGPNATPSAKRLLANTTKKVKVEGPSNYTPNSKMYQLPMTPAQMQRYNKLASSPKTNDTLFTIPKGAAKLPQKEIDAMQRRRVADRKRTLARAESVIRRTKIK